jgi:hypothetical protein
MFYIIIKNNSKSPIRFFSSAVERDTSNVEVSSSNLLRSFLFALPIAQKLLVVTVPDSRPHLLRPDFSVLSDRITRS